MKRQKVVVFPDEEKMILRNRKPIRHTQAKRDYVAIAGTGYTGPTDNTGGGGGGGTPTVADYQYLDMSMIDCTNVVSELNSAQAYLAANQNQLTNTQLSAVSSYIARLNSYNTTNCPHALPYQYPSWSSLDCPTLASEITKLQEYMSTLSGDPSLMQTANYNLNLAKSLQTEKCSGLGGGGGAPAYTYPNWDILNCAQLNFEIAKVKTYIQQNTLSDEQLAEANTNVEKGQSLYGTKCSVVSCKITDAEIKATTSLIAIAPVFSGEVSGFKYAISALSSTTGEIPSGTIASGTSDALTASVTGTFGAGTYQAQLTPVCKDSAQIPIGMTKAFTISADEVKTSNPVLSLATMTSSAYRGGVGGGAGSSETTKKTAAAVKKNNSWLWLLLVAGTIGYIMLKKKGKK